MAAISKPIAMLSAGFALALSGFPAHDDLSRAEIKLLEDPSGWEYVKVSDQDAGIQTEHVCFDGTPHPNHCSGKMIFNPDNTFVQQMTIHGQTTSRRGTYQIDDGQISFFDEFGTRDGPYAAQLNSDAKALVLSTALVRIRLELESQYKADLQKKKAPQH